MIQRKHWAASVQEEVMYVHSKQPEYQIANTSNILLILCVCIDKHLKTDTTIVCTTSHNSHSILCLSNENRQSNTHTTNRELCTRLYCLTAAVRSLCLKLASYLHKSHAKKLNINNSTDGNDKSMLVRILCFVSILNVCMTVIT